MRIRGTVYTEVQRLESDGTTDADTIWLPEDPVFWHAYMVAINERGEEYGEPMAIAERRYYEVLDSAISTDKKHNELTNQYDWYRG